MARTKEVSDGATPAGNGVAVEVLARLALRSGEQRYREQAYALLDTFSGNIQRHPFGYPTMLMGAIYLQQGDRGDYPYAAAGAVQARAQWYGEGKVELMLNIRDGWHINSSAPLQSELMATRVSVAPEASWQLVGVQYPRPHVARLDFLDEPLHLYRGRTTLQLQLSPKANQTLGHTVLKIDLNLQACSDRVCLPPEQIVVSVAPKSIP